MTHLPQSSQAPRTAFDPPLAVILLVALIVFLAAWIRLSGTLWDATAGLHPDERHMLFVSTRLMRALDALKDTHMGWGELWFSEATSPLNPRAKGESYVYGEMPVLATTLIGWFTGHTGWDDVMVLGRQIAALVDSFTVLAVFMMVHPLYGWRTGTAAALLYAAAPTALQLSNFYTVDIWLAAAASWSLLFMLAADRAATRRRLIGSSLAAGLFMGLAMASKITGLALALPALVLAVRLWRKSGFGAALTVVLCGIVTASVTFRLANPFAFAGPGLFGILPASAWIKDLRAVADLSSSLDFPPGWQWMAGYGPLRFSRDAALFGFGPVVTLAAAAALLRWRRFPGTLLIPLSFAAVLILQGLVSQVAVLRYIAPAIPALTAAGAAALAPLSGGWLLAAVAAALWWGAGAVRLHDGNHPRIFASAWIWKLPRGTALLNETNWDEGLPVLLPFRDRPGKLYPDAGGHFTLLNLDIVAPDSEDKIARIADLVSRADYVIISSGRQSEVMPRLPRRFPVTTEYYRLIDSGEGCLEPAWTMDRGYPLPGLALDDRWAQEPWRVYDHPIVRVYRKAPCFDAAAFRGRLQSAFDKARHDGTAQ